MFENHTKGWHGSYSNAGRSSAEQYHMVINKDKIIYGKGKTIKIKGFSNEEDPEPDPVNDMLAQEIDIFDDYEEKRKRKIRQGIDSKNKKKKLITEKIKPLYISPSTTPTCTKYNPKLTCILKRSLSGPNWEKLTGRINSLNEVRLNDLQYCVSYDTLKSAGKNFVDLKYQTQRGPFRSTNDVRYRTDIPFELPKLDKHTQQGTIQSQIKGTFNMNMTNNNNNSSNANVWIQTPSNTIQHKNNNQLIGVISPKPTAKVLFKHNTKRCFIKAPDFKKTISRDYINYLHREKGTSAPLNIPNDSLTKNRTLSMISYEKSIHWNNKNNGFRKIKLDPSLTSYTSNKALKKNCQAYSSAPNFNLMTSRPSDKGPLPFYMQQTCDRNSYYMISSKTLKMNNYANGKLRDGYDSFFPKKSYNKMINMNLLSSDHFIDGALNAENVLGRKLEKPIAKVINYYRKNLDDTNAHKAVNRFDSVTLKSIPRNSVTSQLEKRRFQVDSNYYSN